MTLEELRKSRNLTKKAMADIIGRTVATYSKRERKPIKLKVHEAFRICDGLNLTLEELKCFLDSID